MMEPMKLMMIVFQRSEVGWLGVKQMASTTSNGHLPPWLGGFFSSFLFYLVGRLFFFFFFFYLVEMLFFFFSFLLGWDAAAWITNQDQCDGHDQVCDDLDNHDKCDYED